MAHNQKPREKKIESYLKNAASQRNILALKFISPGASGVPDQVLIGHTGDGHPRVVFVEVKRPEETRRVLQQETSQRMTDAGAYVTAVDSHNSVDECLDTCFGVHTTYDDPVPATFIAAEQDDRTTQKKPKVFTLGFPQP